MFYLSYARKEKGSSKKITYYEWIVSTYASARVEKARRASFHCSVLGASLSLFFRSNSTPPCSRGHLVACSSIRDVGKEYQVVLHVQQEGEERRDSIFKDRNNSKGGEETCSPIPPISK